MIIYQKKFKIGLLLSTTFLLYIMASSVFLYNSTIIPVYYNPSAQFQDLGLGIPRSAVFSGTTYIEQLQNFENASFYEHVSISDGLLYLSTYVNDTNYLPLDRDEFTENESYVNKTLGKWDASYVVTSWHYLYDIHYELGDNYSVKNVIQDDTVNGFRIICDPNNDLDLSTYEFIEWYMKIEEPEMDSYPLNLTSIGLTDHDPMVPQEAFKVTNVKLDNDWHYYKYDFSDFTSGSLNWGAIDNIFWYFEWDETLYEENCSILIDHLAFGKDIWDMYDNGTFISQWIDPNFPIGSWTNIACWTTDIDLTNISISQDNLTWHYIPCINGESSNDDPNLKSLNLDPTLPILFKIELHKGSTPYVDFVIVSFDTLNTFNISLVMFTIGDPNLWILATVVLAIATAISILYILSRRDIRRKITRSIESHF